MSSGQYGGFSYDACMVWAADNNEDGLINIIDLIDAVNYILGQPTCTWTDGSGATQTSQAGYPCMENTTCDCTGTCRDNITDSCWHSWCNSNPQASCQYFSDDFEPDFPTFVLGCPASDLHCPDQIDIDMCTQIVLECDGDSCEYSERQQLSCDLDGNNVWNYMDIALLTSWYNGDTSHTCTQGYCAGYQLGDTVTASNVDQFPMGGYNFGYTCCCDLDCV